MGLEASHLWGVSLARWLDIATKVWRTGTADWSWLEVGLRLHEACGWGKGGIVGEIGSKVWVEETGLEGLRLHVLQIWHVLVVCGR